MNMGVSYMKKMVLAVSAIALLSACSATTGGALRTANHSDSPVAQMYGDYLVASYANSIGDAQARSEYYSAAFARRPADLVLGRKAMVSALNAGDDVLSRTLAIEVHAMDERDELARSILGADAFAHKKYKQAVDILGDEVSESGYDDLNALVRGWGQVALGDTDGALDTFGRMGGRYFQLFGDLQKAKLYAELGDVENAEIYFKQIDEIGVSAIESLLSQVRFYSAQDDQDKAKALLDAYAEANGGALTGPVRVYIDALESGQKIKRKLTPVQSASRALTEPAFSIFAVQKQYESAEIFLRLALELDPDNDKARLFLGNVLENTEREEDAMVEYKALKPTSDYSVSARLSEANLLFADDKDAQAITVLEAIHDTHPSLVTQESIGRAYLIMEDYAQALPYYDALIASMSNEELANNPRFRYLRGICLERLERWQEAVVEFEFVLEHDPDNADALNYLGYTWVDKGVELTKAFGMIRKAVELEPKSGAIIDSLGWAHYKMGQYGEARVKLEDAVERAPSSATVVDHLGDVYWKVGRRREAEYQWRRAVDLDPTDKERRILKAKLKGGLEAGKNVE